jgi:hypothetical protein
MRWSASTSRNLLSVSQSDFANGRAAPHRAPHRDLTVEYRMLKAFVLTWKKPTEVISVKALAAKAPASTDWNLDCLKHSR